MTRGTHGKFNFFKRAILGSTLLFTALSWATHDDAEAALALYQEAPAEDQVVSRASATSTLPNSNDAHLDGEAQALAARLADLFVCVPGRMDSDYSTQSWYLLNTFLGFNNAVAKSNYANDKAAGESFKKNFIDKAISQIKGRNPGLENDEKIQAYIQSLASTAEIVFKNALEKRAVYKKSTDLNHLLAQSHPAGEPSVFTQLKAAHASQVGFLKNQACTGIKSSFWETPQFSFPSTTESARQVVSAASIPRASTSSGSATSTTTATASTTHTGSSTATSSAPRTIQEIDAKYNRRSKRISEKLPFSSWDDRKKNGYHTYYGSNGYLWGRPYVIGNILKAANVLKDKGIYMGVGDINREPYFAWPYHRETPGHGSHDEGRAVDLRLIGPDGEATACTVEDPSCFSKEKTFEMVKALIDTDPQQISVIYINSPSLRKMIEDYLVSAHGYSRSRADNAVQYYPCHHNHVHFHWKDDY
ncbi:MAG: hypothetical protein R3A80_09325 [Bdellovibrionota bacterium]